ncbi:MAG: lipocalin-like domain-containing protein [Pseudomonadota bacterium]
MFLAGCDAGRLADPAPSLQVGRFLGGDASAEFERADEVRRFVFPQDHGPHPGFRSEWWYVTAVLADADGREFGAQFTLFRQALRAPREAARDDNPWRSGQAFLAHLAVTDVAADQHLHAQRFSRGHPDNASVETEPTFLARIDDWTLAATDDGRWLLSAADRELAVELWFEMSEGVVLQGEQGLSAKGPGQASYYYSLPGMPVRGELRVEDERHSVVGRAWMDREWSTSVLGDHLAGWDWFSLYLDDERSLMAFRLRRKDGARDPYDHGKLVAASAAQTLSAEDFELHPEVFWRDAAGYAWPIGWRLTLGAETFVVRALVDDQLMHTGITYYEGIVGVFGADGRRRLGRGYMELTGYDQQPDLQQDH